MGGRPWLAEEEAALAHAVQDFTRWGQPVNWHVVASRVGRSARSCANKVHHARHFKEPVAGAVPDLPPEPSPQPRSTRADVHDLLTLPIRPFHVPVPLAAPSQEGDGGIAVVYGDTHFPEQNEAALAVVKGIIRDAKPSLVVHMGDLLDCYAISRFSRDPKRRESLQDEIDMARAHLHEIAQLAPGARRVYLEGNHEDRLRKLIWDLPGGASELSRLTAFREAMTWPTLLGLNDIGWEFRPYQGQSRHPQLIPNLTMVHGWVVRKWSASSGHGQWDAVHTSGCSGHVHRLGLWFHKTQVWAEAGCTCSLQPEYAESPDWQSGLLTITYSADRFNIEPVYVHHDGIAVWRGRRYGGKPALVAA